MYAIIDGAQCALEGFKLLFSPGLRKFAFIPFFISAAIFAIGCWYAFNAFSNFTDIALTALPKQLDLVHGLQWLNSPYQGVLNLIHWGQHVLHVLFLIAYIAFTLYTFTLLANVISAPFNGAFAAAVEYRLTACAAHKTTPILENTLQQTLLNELRKYRYYVRCLIVLLVASLIALLIPFAQPLLPVLWFVFSGWMLTVEYTGFAMENSHINFHQSKQLLAKNKLLSLGFGVTMAMIAIVPVVNFFTVPVGVAGATVLFVKKFNKGSPPGISSTRSHLG